jgi:microcin C transport system ATP-binding protein
MRMLTVTDLSIRFQGNSSHTVDRISFYITQGETFALVGESGSGKSITALSIMRLLSSQHVSYPSGSIQYHCDDILTMPEAQLRRLRGNRIGIIFQEPMSALNPLHTIGKQLHEALSTHQHLSPEALKTRILELLEEVELPYLSNRLNAYPHQLSGGERQRIMIAMAIANHPELLIADEPTTALDVHVQQQIMQLLKKLQKNKKMAILLISHDLHLVRKNASRVAIMQSGHIVETGDVNTVFASPQHPYTQKLLDSSPKGQAIPLPKKSIQLLECNNISVQFPTQKNWLGITTHYKKAVDNISLTLAKGETLGIVGESGSGKTTLAQAIARLISSNGTCVFRDIQLNTSSSETIRNNRKYLQYIFQDPYASLNPRLSIEQIIREGLDIHESSLSESEKQKKIHTIMDEVGLSSSMLQRYPHEFSGGQRQRISIARAMILNPNLVILDEPTSALDLSLQSQILELLRHLQQKYQTSYLFITHDLNVIRAIAHRIIVMHQGSVVESGVTQDIFEMPRSDYTKMLIQAIA